MGPRLRWNRVVLLTLILVVTVGIAPAGTIRAQGGGSLGYGSKVIGKVSAEMPVVTYSFNGTQGDLVQVTVRNWVGSLDPLVEVVGPDGQTAARSALNTFAADTHDAYLSFYLSQTGIYLLSVSGENGTVGDFILKLQGRGGIAATPLVYGQGVDVVVPQNPQPQYYTFEAQDCPTTLTVADLSEGQPFTFPFIVKVRDQQGQEIALLWGGDALEDRVMLAPQSGRYEVEVSSNDPLAEGMVHLLVTCSDQAPGCISGSLAGSTGEDCPSCFDEFGGEACDAFEVSATMEGENVASFSWSPVEGAEWYIFSIVDAFGSLLPHSPVMLEGETSHSYTFTDEELARGPFTAHVNAGAEGVGTLCADAVSFGPGDGATEECSGITVAIHIVPGEGRRAVVEWSAVPGAAAYLIHVYAYGEDGSLIGIRVFTAPGDATTYHLEADVLPADYERFNVSVRAYSTAEGGGAFGDMPRGLMCGGSADVEFAPLGPVDWGPGAGD